MRLIASKKQTAPEGASELGDTTFGAPAGSPAGTGQRVARRCQLTLLASDAGAVGGCDPTILQNAPERNRLLSFVRRMKFRRRRPETTSPRASPVYRPESCTPPSRSPVQIAARSRSLRSERRTFQVGELTVNGVFYGCGTPHNAHGKSTPHQRPGTRGDTAATEKAEYMMTPLGKGAAATGRPTTDHQS